MAFGGEIDVGTRPRGRGDEEERLGGYEFQVCLIQGGVVLDHFGGCWLIFVTSAGCGWSEGLIMLLGK